MRTKLIIAIILILAATSAVFYFLFQISMSSPKESANESTKNTAGIVTPDSLIESRDLDGCQKLADSKKKEACVDIIASLLAKEKNDASFCEKLSGKEDVSGCKKMVFYDKVQKEEDVKICEQLGDDKEKRDCEEEYYFTMALENKDTALCSKMTEKPAEEDCVDQVVFSKEFIADQENFDCERFLTSRMKTQCQSMKNLN